MRKSGARISGDGSLWRSTQPAATTRGFEFTAHTSRPIPRSLGDRHQQRQRPPRQRHLPIASAKASGFELNQPLRGTASAT